MPVRPLRAAAAASTALAVGSLLLTGCGSSAGDEAPSLHDQLPQRIRDAGVIKVGSDLSYAPVESRGHDGSAVGLEPELAAALGKVLNIRFEFQNTSFDKIIPQMQAKNLDIAMSAMNDTKERRDGTNENGTRINEGVDFVDYFIGGTSILVAKGNPHRIGGLNDLCGHTIAIEAGTTQFSIAERQQEACRNLGKPLEVLSSTTGAEALAQLKSGLSVADLSDFPVAAYNSRSASGDVLFEVAVTQLEPTPFGIAVRKADTELRDVLVKAVDSIIVSGQYDKILKAWNVSAGAAQNAVVNGG
jgi:polar amino acid transport system substrate-binding protein